MSTTGTELTVFYLFLYQICMAAHLVQSNSRQHNMRLNILCIAIVRNAAEIFVCAKICGMVGMNTDKLAYNLPTMRITICLVLYILLAMYCERPANMVALCIVNSKLQAEK